MILYIVVILTAFIPIVNSLGISVSTGNSEGNSRLGSKFLTSSDDFVNQHIVANPREGTISNAVSGTGTLLGDTLSITNNGNTVSVYRQVLGLPGITSYDYSWSTDKTDTHVFAYEGLSASNAISIEAKASAKNSNGISANVNTKITSPTAQAQLKNYGNGAIASKYGTSAWQQADYASATGLGGGIDFAGDAKNYVGGKRSTSMNIKNGQIYDPYLTISAYDSALSPLYDQYAGLSASSLNGQTVDIKSDLSNGEGDKASISVNINDGGLSNFIVPGWLYTDGGYTSLQTPWGFSSSSTLNGKSGKISSISENNEGDKTSTNVNIDNGIINDPFIYTNVNANGIDGLFYATSLSGQSAEIKSNAENKALSKQITFIGIPGTTFEKELIKDYIGGSAEFAVKKINNNPFNRPDLTTSATSNDVGVNYWDNSGTKKALILEPFCQVFGSTKVAKYLEDAGYAVTTYANAGVSKDMIQNHLGDYDISFVRTHGNDVGGGGLGFSKYSDMVQSYPGDASDHWVWANTMHVNANDMIILDACDVFNPSSTLDEVIASAKVSGGHVGRVNPRVDALDMSNFFKHLAAGDTVEEANNQAYAIEIPGVSTKLKLQGDLNYRLVG